MLKGKRKEREGRRIEMEARSRRENRRQWLGSGSKHEVNTPTMQTFFGAAMKPRMDRPACLEIDGPRQTQVRMARGVVALNPYIGGVVGHGPRRRQSSGGRSYHRVPQKHLSRKHLGRPRNTSMSEYLVDFWGREQRLLVAKFLGLTNKR